MLFDKFRIKERQDHENSVLISIVNNLNNILNTKRGFGSFLVDYGIRDLNEFSSRGDIAKAVMEEVRHNIEEFEPRVEFVNMVVETSNNAMFLAFKIECRVRDRSRDIHLLFDTVFNSFRVQQ